MRYSTMCLWEHMLDEKRDAFAASTLPKPPRECLKVWHRAERWQQPLELSILLGIHLPMILSCSCELFCVAFETECEGLSRQKTP